MNEVERRADGWEVVYECPRTAVKWILDTPLSEEHGGGPTRLRRLPL